MEIDFDSTMLERMIQKQEDWKEEKEETNKHLTELQKDPNKDQIPHPGPQKGIGKCNIN